jgi:DNA replication protein DnaC
MLQVHISLQTRDRLGPTRHGWKIEQSERPLLIGGSGTGKSHLATSLAIEACARGKRVRFYRVTEMATQLLEAREERVLSRLKSQLSKVELLVLDELGYVPASKVGAELLFDVISTAYERLSVIVTTNLPFEEWKEVLGSERLTGATLDRLTHRCTIVETGKESYRLRDARRRRSTRGNGAVGRRHRGHRAVMSEVPALRSSADPRHGFSPTVTTLEG